MSGRRPRPRAGAASVESCIAAAILVTLLVAGPTPVPQLLARALECAMAAVVAAVGAELP